MKEENPKDSKFIDSSIWLSYIIEGKIKDYIESNKMPLISALTLYEINKRLLKLNISNDIIESFFSFIKKKSIIINVDEKIAKKASLISYENNLPAFDSIIYASSLLNNSILITRDNDFRGLKDIELV